MLLTAFVSFRKAAPDVNPVRPLTPIQMRLTHSRGRAQNHRLVIPPNGIGLSALLRLDGRALSWKNTREADECRIEWADNSWILRNGSRVLVCAIDGQRIRHGEEAALAVGAAVEIELMRLTVEAVTAAPGDLVDTPKPVPQVLEPTHDTESFDLQDMARTGDGQGLVPGPIHRQPVGEPAIFGGILPTQLPDAAGSGAANAAQLDATLASLDLAAIDIHQRYASNQSATTAGLPGGHANRPVHPPCPPSAQPPSDGDLELLHVEYQLALMDPTHIRTGDDWHAPAATTNETSEDWDVMVNNGARKHLVRDTVGGRISIDVAIDSIDVLDEVPLELSSEDEVLGLFAPDQLRRIAVRMPELTLREHHTISPDSSVRIEAGAVTGEDASASRENTP